MFYGTIRLAKFLGAAEMKVFHVLFTYYWHTLPMSYKNSVLEENINMRM